MVVKNKTTRVGDVGDPNAKPGTRAWAVAVRCALAACIHDVEFSSDRACELADAMKKHEGWSQLEDQNGTRFPNYEAFCVAPVPFGLGHSSEVIDRIIKERRENELKRAKAAPLNGHGTNQHNKGGVANGKSTVGTNDRSYIARRLARDAPEILDRWDAGEFKSAKAAKEAAIASGLWITKPRAAKAVAANGPEGINEIGERRARIREFIQAEADGQPPHVRINIADLLQDIAKELRA